MPRKIPTALERLAALDTKRQDILEQRKKELIRIFEGCNAFTIDDSLLAGFLLFAANQGNKDHPTLKEFKELAAKGKTPGLIKRRRRNALKPKIPLPPPIH